MIAHIGSARNQRHSLRFRALIRTDHGNVEASGCGRPKEGVLAEVRGERVRIFSGAVLRHSVALRFSDVLEWSSIGLPQDYLPLLAPSRKAFIPAGSRTV